MFLSMNIRVLMSGFIAFLPPLEFSDENVMGGYCLSGWSGGVERWV
jgi:hypothetical protein